MPAYLDTAAVRAFASVPSTVGDDLLAPFLDAVETQLRLTLGYDPVFGTRTQFFDGTGTDRLPVGMQVKSVVSVHENRLGYYDPANFTADELLTEGEDYAVEREGGRLSGVLRRLRTVWPYDRARRVDRLAAHTQECVGSVRVVFTQGLSPPELNLLRVAGHQAAAALWQIRAGLGPKQSESLDGYSYSLANLMAGDDLPALVSKYAAALVRPLSRVPLA